MQTLRRDLLFSLCQMRMHPALSAAIILTLGLAIRRPYNFSGPGRPEEWKTTLATGNLFSVLACIAPAWRVSRLDPAITLRQK